jgi:hypothetical protein
LLCDPGELGIHVPISSKFRYRLVDVACWSRVDERVERLDGFDNPRPRKRRSRSGSTPTTLAAVETVVSTVGSTSGDTASVVASFRVAAALTALACCDTVSCSFCSVCAKAH